MAPVPWLTVAKHEGVAGTFSWYLPPQFLAGLPDDLAQEEVNRLGVALSAALESGMVAIMMAALADPRRCTRLTETDNCFKQMAQVLQQTYRQTREPKSTTTDAGSEADTSSAS